MFRNTYVINITEHASVRVKERLKIKGTSAQRMAFKAYREGIDSSNAKGQLATYIKDLDSRYDGAAFTKVYNEFAWVFSKEDSKGRTHKTENRESIINLVTAYAVPGEES